MNTMASAAPRAEEETIEMKEQTGNVSVQTLVAVLRSKLIDVRCSLLNLFSPTPHFYLQVNINSGPSTTS